MSAHLDLLQKQKKTSKKKVSSDGGVVKGKQLDGKKKKNKRESYHSPSIMQVCYCHCLEEMLGKALQ